MAKHTEKASEQRSHRATYSRDKMKGGYVIRVLGPHASRFAGREVPVTRKDFSESTEKLESLLWTGKDRDTGDPVALYSFAPKPKDESEVDDLPF